LFDIAPASIFSGNIGFTKLARALGWLTYAGLSGSQIKQAMRKSEKSGDTDPAQSGSL
jgi:hypothetical protein